MLLFAECIFMSAHLFHQPFLLKKNNKKTKKKEPVWKILSYLWSFSSGHLSISLIPWFPPSCFPSHHTLSIALLPRSDSLWTLSSVSFSVPTMAPSLLPQWHILRGCEGGCSTLPEVWSSRLERDQLCIKSHCNYAGVARLSLLLLQWQQWAF